MSKIKLNFSSVIMFLAIALIAHSSYIPAKARLSQQLIYYSWQQSIKDQSPRLPWPWADTYPVAKLSFPSLKKETVVLMGADETTLAFSAGMLHQFSSMNQLKPVVIAGHRDTHFAVLEEIKMKDIIMLADRSGKNTLYEVEQLEIIDSAEKELFINNEEPSLILVTCYPFNAIQTGSSLRYIIKAKRLS